MAGIENIKNHKPTREKTPAILHVKQTTPSIKPLPLVSAKQSGNKNQVTHNSDYTKNLDEKTKKLIEDKLKEQYIKLQKELNETKKHNGFIGKSWDWIKNTTGLGASSNKAQAELNKMKKELTELDKNPEKLGKVYKDLTGRDLNSKELNKLTKGKIELKATALNKYKNGQEMAVDVASDFVAGFAAMGIYTLAITAAPFSGGASVIAGIAAAGASAAAIKAGIKYLDAKTGGRKYTTLGFDLATGALNGAIAPVTGGFGGAMGRTFALGTGVQVFKEAGEEVVQTGLKQAVREMLFNPAGYKYVGGNAIRRIASTGLEMLADGSISGAADNSLRAGLKGENILKAAEEGFVGGLISAPIIGGGFKLVGKAGRKFGSLLKGEGPENKINISKVEELTPESHNDIVIPKGKFEAPSSKFAETEEAFKSIIIKRKKDFIKLNKIKDDETFLREVYKIFEEEMDIKGISPELKIDPSHKTRGVFSEYTGDIKINLENIKDRSEMVSILAHELNHFIQFKEQLVTPDIGIEGIAIAQAQNVIRKNPSLDLNAHIEAYYKHFSESPFVKKILDDPRYPHNPSGSEFANKAELYSLNNEKYIDKNESVQLSGTLKEYEEQILERESYDRGDAVGTTFNEHILNKKEPVSTRTINNSAEVNNAKIAKTRSELIKQMLSLKDSNNKPILAKGFIKARLKEIIDRNPHFDISEFSKMLHEIKPEVLKEYNYYLFEELIRGANCKPEAPSVLLAKKFNFLAELDKNNDIIFHKDNKDLCLSIKSENQLDFAKNLHRNEICSRYIRNIITLSGDNKDLQDLALRIKPNPIDNGSSIDACIGLAKKSPENLKKINFIMSKMKNVYDNEIAHFVQHADDETLKIIQQRDLFNIIPKYNKGLIQNLKTISETEWEAIMKRPELLSSGKTESVYSLQCLASMDDAKYSRIKDNKLLNRNLGEGSDENELWGLLNVKEEKWGKIVERGLLDVNRNNSHLRLSEIEDLLELSSDEWKNAQDRGLLKFFQSRKEQFSSSGICSLAKLSPEEWNKAKSLLYIEGRGANQFSGAEICILAKLDDDKFDLIKRKGFLQNNKLNSILTYSDFYKLEGKSDLNELSIAEKRNLLKALIKHNANLFDEDFQKISTSEILPKNKDEYCTLLPKIVKSIGIDVRPLSKETKMDYFSAMDSLETIFKTTNLEDPNLKINLSYSRKTFIYDIEKLLSSLTPNERAKATDYFGFELKTNEDGTLQLNGYPINVNNGAKMTEIKNPNTKAIIEKIRPFVSKFTEHNTISVDGNPELSQELNKITKAFPEFLTTIGKKQHDTHSFTVDVHTLRVLQGVMSDVRYKALPIEDKRAIQIATLLHDLTKAEELIDKTHPTYSAFDAYCLLEKMDMSETEKLKIYQIIKNHDWLEHYNAPKITSEQRTGIAKDIAFELRQGNSFEMASILAEANLTGVQRNGAFFKKYQDALNLGNNEISELVQELKQTAIHLPQEKLPKASEIIADGINVKEIETGGIKNKVIYLKPNMDLSKLNFKNGLNSNDLNVLVHALDYGDQSAIFQALGQVDSEALLSTSYITYGKGNYHVFRKQGFILDVASDDIHAAYFRDFGSGYTKNMETLKTEYLFNGARKGVREYMANLLKEKLGLNNEQYIKLFHRISDKSINELDETNPDVAKAIREIFNEMEDGKRANNRQYNEVLVTRPKIQGVFAYGQKAEDIPEFLRKYAEENNLPIIIFGE